MAQLILMRQRIKAVETIKKITHAMQLISMSSHSRLRHQQEGLDKYQQEVSRLLEIISSQVLSGSSFYRAKKQNEELLILIGSQKSLCGSFNNNLFKFFHKHELETASPFPVITVGKEAGSYIQQFSKINLVKRLDLFSSLNFVFIADEITRIILAPDNSYRRVKVYYNYPLSFFVQEPRIFQLLPLVNNFQESNKQDEKAFEEEYIWEYSPAELYNYVLNLTVKVNLQRLLFSSLLAEQSARFIAMDAATRNADKIITQMRLEYNKTRQAQITRELTDLTSSIQTI